MKKHQLVRSQITVPKHDLISGEIQDQILDQLGRLMIRELYYSGYLKINTLEDIHNYQFDQGKYEASIVVIRHDDINELSEIANQIPTIRIRVVEPMDERKNDMTVVDKFINLKDYI